MRKFFEKKSSKSSNPREKLINDNLIRPAALKEEIYIKEQDWAAIYELCKQRRTQAEDIDQPWQLVAFSGDVTAIKHYFSQHPELLNARHASGRRAIHFAAWGGKLAAVKHFYEQGYEIQATDKCAHPLLYAALSGEVAVVGYLVNLKDIDKNTRFAGSGENLAHFAVESGSLAMIKAVADLGIDFNSKDLQGKTALKLAEELGGRDFLRQVQKVLSPEADNGSACRLM